MSTINDQGQKYFPNTAVAIAAWTRVTMDSSGNILASGADNLAIGVVDADIAASTGGNVRMFAPTTFFKAAGAIVRAAPLYAIAAGLVDDAGVTTTPFIALETASAANDIIECARVL